jgi:hypothetical protein
MARPDGPGSRAPWGFWATSGWILIAVIAVILGLIPTLMVLEHYFGRFDLEASSIPFELGFWVGEIILALVVVIAARSARWTAREYLALTVPRWQSILFWLACLALWDVVSAMLERLVNLRDIDAPEFDYLAAQAAGVVGWYVVSVVLVAPICEEIVFRGFIYRGWSQTRAGRHGGVLLTALLFGIAHLQYNWFGIFDCTVFGVIVGAARWRTGSLLVPVALHMAQNLAATVDAAT